MIRFFVCVAFRISSIAIFLGQNLGKSRVKQCPNLSVLISVCRQTKPNKFSRSSLWLFPCCSHHERVLKLSIFFYVMSLSVLLRCKCRGMFVYSQWTPLDCCELPNQYDNDTTTHSTDIKALWMCNCMKCVYMYIKCDLKRMCDSCRQKLV